MLMSDWSVSSMTRTFATCACASRSVAIESATEGVGSGATRTDWKLLGRSKYCAVRIQEAVEKRFELPHLRQLVRGVSFR